MLVRDAMNPTATQILSSATVRQATVLLRSSQASDLMVVDDHGQFIGVLSEGDLLRAFLPKFEELAAEGSLSAADELFSDKAKDLADRPIAPYILKDIVIVKPGDAVSRASALMISRMIRRLPVVENGRLVGTIARADIAHGIIAK